ncbi:MAG: UPF0182 family protein [Fimbriimonas sp.]
MDQQPNIPRIEIDPRSVRRVLRVGSVLLGLVLIGSFLLSALIPYTDYLWFVHDVRYPAVFTTAYAARGTLFLTAFLISWAVLYFNLRQALNLTLIYLSAPESVGQAVISQTMKWVQDRGRTVLKYAAPFLAFVAAAGFANEWLTLLVARNAQSFGVNDPLFGLDLGFYVFTLPWYRALANYAFVLLVITAVATIGLYVGLQALALLARIELSQPRFRLHVSLLIGATLLALSLQTWLKSYEYTVADSAQFTGAGYVEVQEMIIQRGLALFIGLVALATILLPRRGKPYSIPMAGGIAAAVLWALGMLAYPTFVRRFVVDPDRLNKEGPFAERAIKMTRFAYGLDKIEVKDTQVQRRPTVEAVKASEATLGNMRLWDPEVLRTALESLQGMRPYYEFQDVDIDRYMIDGKQTPVMVSSRDILLDGLEPTARNWTNLRLRYTHGYGVTVSRVDRATNDGRPEFMVDGIPIQNRGAIRVEQPRIYFSDWRDGANQPESEYALVNTGEAELDYETATGATTHKWEGDRGVPVSGFLTRLAFSTVLRDGNLLVSPNVRAGAKLLMRRGVLERVGKVFPFLQFDSDPYLVVLGKKLVWVLDGYSTTGSIPYSARLFGVNYIRNSVKATVDAYTGEVRGFAIEPEEPLLKAYRAIYPGLVRDLSEAPAGLKEHFRYPEDLLRMQAVQLQAYHVTNATTFLSNSDAWKIGTELDIHGQRAVLRPFYVQMQLPDQAKAGFMQILPFTPNRKPNMSGWLAAHCDPDSYGKLSMYRFVGNTPDGPELMESNFNSTPEISEINRQFNNEQSSVLPGNLLVIPIGQSVMYVEPLFLQSVSQGIQAAPRLSWVVLAFSDRIVVGTSYEDALRRLLATSPTAPVVRPPTAPNQPTPTEGPTPRKALELLEQADAAMRKGDWAKYGELQKQLRKVLEELVTP